MLYRAKPHMSYGRKRAVYQIKILKLLMKQGPLTKSQIKELVIVPSKGQKTFERAFKNLKDEGLVTEDKSSGLFYAHGHEPPETVEIHVGSSNLELTIPAKREQAKKVIEKTPELKQDKQVSAVLKETGLLEKA